MRPVRSLLSVLCVAAAVGCGGACEDEPPTPKVITTVKAVDETPEPPAVSLDEAIVVSVEGTVEIRRGDRPSWENAKIGDKIAANDALRTAMDSQMQMQVGEAKVTVLEKSDLRVQKIQQGQLRARVSAGHIEAAVKEGSGASVEMEADGTDTVVTTTGGEFSMTSDGHGIVAVATKSGVASLRVAGKQTLLKAGEMGKVVDDRLSRDEIRELLMAVSWPGKRETNKAVIPVSGRAPVGSRVIVQGVLVRVDRKGAWRTKVPVKQGKQRVAVKVTSVRGQRREESAEFLVDRKNFLKAEKSDWGSSN